MNIIHPTLLIDKTRCLANIKRMALKARKHNLSFKPHFKTHQSIEVGKWFMEQGVRGITVSSIKMATYFADAGWQDITIAFPVNVNAMSEINKLAEKVNLTLLLDNMATVEILDKGITSTLNILVELDAGSKRTGISVDDDKTAQDVVRSVEKSRNLSWKGFYSHFGHTYSCRGENEVKSIFENSRLAITSLMERNSWGGCNLHIGDTPGCSLSTDFSGISTITPGNFVFYDVMQEAITSCTRNEIAVAMACPVISKNAQRKEITVHGGAVHFSKDRLSESGLAYYGLMTKLTSSGIEHTHERHKVVSLSQEHGTISVGDDFDKYRIGEIVGVLPVHSCLTAECMGGYKDFGGNEIDHL